MVLSRYELAAQIRVTAEYIAADPSVVAVTRPDTERVPGGGRRPVRPGAAISWAGRFIPAGIGTEVTTPAGAVVKVAGVFLAMPGTDMQYGDIFEYLGETYEVIAVQDALEYEMKAKVTSRGAR